MEDVCCSVCMDQFHEKDVVPKTLDCSHTFCASCVQKLNNSSRECPTCRKKMTRTEYPTSLVALKFVDHFNGSNYKATSFVSTIKSVEEIKEMKLEVAEKLERVRGEVEKLIVKKENLERERERLNKKIGCDLQKLNKKIDEKQKITQSFKNKQELLVLLEGNGNDFDVEEESDIEEEGAQGGLVTLEQENFEDGNFFGKEEEGAQGGLVTLERANFEDGNAFRKEVVGRVRRPIAFWFADVKEETLYGKSTAEDKFMVLHSLSHLRGDIGQDVTLIRDLVPLSPSDGMEAFLLLGAGPDGPEVEVRVRLHPLHPNTNHFLLLCTGQRGPSYKGAPVVDRRGRDYGSYSGLFEVPNYLDNGREKSGAIHPVPYSVVRRVCERGEVVLRGFEDGSFWLGKITERGRLLCIVGVVTSPSPLDLESFGRGRPVRVRDCGIRVPF